MVSENHSKHVLGTRIKTHFIVISLSSYCDGDLNSSFILKTFANNNLKLTLNQEIVFCMYFHHNTGFLTLKAFKMCLGKLLQQSVKLMRTLSQRNQTTRQVSQCLPLVIHMLVGCAVGAAGWAGAPNMSANGLPSCSKSSDAFVAAYVQNPKM